MLTILYISLIHKLYDTSFRLKRMVMMVQNWDPKRPRLRRGSGVRRSSVRAPVSLASRWGPIRWPLNRAWLRMANSGRSTSHRSSNTHITCVYCNSFYSFTVVQYMAPVQLEYYIHVNDNVKRIRKWVKLVYYRYGLLVKCSRNGVIVHRTRKVGVPHWTS